jgi:hypothetical protein
MGIIYLDVIFSIITIGDLVGQWVVHRLKPDGIEQSGSEWIVWLMPLQQTTLALAVPAFSASVMPG